MRKEQPRPLEPEMYEKLAEIGRELDELFDRETQGVLVAADEAVKSGGDFSEPDWEKYGRVVSQVARRMAFTSEGEKWAENAEQFVKIYTHPFFEGMIQFHNTILHMMKEMEWQEWGEPAREGQSTNTARVHYLFGKVLEHYKLDPEKVLPAWRESVASIPRKGAHNLSEQWQQLYTMDNLEALRLLERERPGSANVLMEEFGVVNFTRFPTELLVRQYDERNEPGRYGLIAVGKRDYNGIFFHMKSKYEDLQEKLPEGWKLRAVELGSKIDIARTLIAMDRRYGKQDKISFAFVSAHGRSKSLSMGDWTRTKGATLKLEDLEKGKGIEKLPEYFAPNSTIVIHSCLVGRKGGIGEHIYNRSGITVDAFKTSVALLDVTNVEPNGENLKFDVRFEKPLKIPKKKDDNESPTSL